MASTSFNFRIPLRRATTFALSRRLPCCSRPIAASDLEFVCHWGISSCPRPQLAQFGRSSRRFYCTPTRRAYPLSSTYALTRDRVPPRQASQSSSATKKRSRYGMEMDPTTEWFRASSRRESLEVPHAPPHADRHRDHRSAVPLSATPETNKTKKRKKGREKNMAESNPPEPAPATAKVDSAVDSASVLRSTASLSRTVMKFRQRNGRTYHS